MRPPGRRRRLLLAAPAVAYAALILALSSLSGSQVPSTGVSGGDKILHLVEYGILGVLLLIPVRDLGGKGALVALAAGAVFAASDEFHQAFVPGRTADVWDLAADVAVLLLVVAVAEVLRRARTPADSE